MSCALHGVQAEAPTGARDLSDWQPGWRVDLTYGIIRLMPARPTLKNLSCVAAFLLLAQGCSTTVDMHRPVTPADLDRVTKVTAGQTVRIEFTAPTTADTQVREGLLMQDSGAFVLGAPSEPASRIPSTAPAASS